MAKPRVLISSTCKDLYLIREQLRELIDDIGYDPILSEDGDIFYSPDLHTHLSCIREIKNCDMVVLIVGNKFGTEFITKNDKSVTQVEHETAHSEDLPIFAFIDEHVLHDYNIYLNVKRQNINKPQVIQEKISQIPFASNVDARVFKFIDSINEKIKK